MKWSITGLLLLGVAAAVSASVLVASLKIGSQAVASSERIPEDVQILVAARNLPSMSVVDARSVMVKTIPATDVPENVLRRSTDVVGKLLVAPVVEGQAFTAANFADDKSGARLASALSSGMRAVSVSLTPDRAGLLYPGCVVDVLVSLSRQANGTPMLKEAMSMTLLQGVEVLAIDDSSIMSDAEKADPETETSSRRMRRERLVTLVLNSNQAKALQLAMHYGTVSLALRNPLDATPVETDSTMLSDLADEYSRILAVLSPPGREAELARMIAGGQPGAPAEKVPATAAAPVEKTAAAPPPAAEPAVPAVEDPMWQTVVNRGGQIELVRFRRPGFWGVQDKPEPDWKWEGRAVNGNK